MALRCTDRSCSNAVSDHTIRVIDNRDKDHRNDSVEVIDNGKDDCRNNSIQVIDNEKDDCRNNSIQVIDNGKDDCRNNSIKFRDDTLKITDNCDRPCAIVSQRTISGDFIESLPCVDQSDCNSAADLFMKDV